jgi:hypothetical protein
MERRDEETLVAFLDRLENLEELTVEEMRTLSNQVKVFRSRWGKKR